MVARNATFVPPPMPQVRAAQHHLVDASEALLRAGRAWNSEQLRDALRSAKDMIAAAEAAHDAEAQRLGVL